jgi:hypothetical protein
MAEELDGEYPGLELAVLRAYQDAVFSGYGEGLRGLCGTGDDEAGLGEREGWDLGLQLGSRRGAEEEDGGGDEEIAWGDHRRPV